MENNKSIAETEEDQKSRESLAQFTQTQLTPDVTARLMLMSLYALVHNLKTASC
jgi:hypothetical protein